MARRLAAVSGLDLARGLALLRGNTEKYHALLRRLADWHALDATRIGHRAGRRSGACRCARGRRGAGRLKQSLAACIAASPSPACERLPAPAARAQSL